MLKEKRCDYDVILLDIDNGPEGLTCKSNDWLYSREGLEAAFAALRTEGVLAVWSVSSDRSFTRRLKQAGFEVKRPVYTLAVPVVEDGTRSGLPYAVHDPEQTCSDVAAFFWRV